MTEIQESGHVPGPGANILTFNSAVRLPHPVNHQDDESIGNMRYSASPSPSIILTPYTLAAEALNNASGDTHKAAEALADILRRPDIAAKLAIVLVRDAARMYVAKVESNTRSQIERMAFANTKIAGRAIAVASAFLDWPLPFGGTLRNATRFDLAKAIDHYESSGKTALRRAAWLNVVAARVSEGALVEAVWTEAELAAAFRGEQP
jgi:hypothetical protein